MLVNILVMAPRASRKVVTAWLYLNAGEYPSYGPQGQQEGGDGRQLPSVPVTEVGNNL